ncbi:hypothetical protein Acr_13g0003670 [Actinidia rufa]|uniref:Bulb-type lectin domain-containing protein n=1 Tax=Actinidia rufa TaxID=165716 RepID=A0A7J0FKI6_9ERIC|nr:hypothetical protein Acr_13g0003670 [Actinidia rufa]
MACSLPHILFFLLFLLPLSTVAQTNGTVAIGVPVPSGSKVVLTANRGLVLSDPQGKELWSSETILNDVTHGFMNDSGNFVLVRSDSVTLWESFKYPTDTMLPTQIMESGGVLFSRQTETNFSRGRFQLRLLGDGNLVLNTRELATGFTYAAYYWSNTYDADNILNRGYQVIFNETGYLFVLRRNNQRVELTPKLVVPTSDYYHRVTLDFDGVLNQYYHPKTATGNPKWTALWSQPDNICVDIDGIEGIGACGYNSICTLNDYRRPECSCPEGFSVRDPNDKYGSCKPSFTPSCEEDDRGSAEDLYGLVELIDTDWPTSDYEHLKPSSEDMCRKSCLEDCFCAVPILRDGGCLKKKLPLSNGRKDASVNSKAFMKFRKGDPLPPPTFPRSTVRDTKKNDRTLILIVSVLLGSSLNAVAVKKLDGVVQNREKEFRTEVHVIGQTHHKNLVHLIGFCDEGGHRMLEDWMIWLEMIWREALNDWNKVEWFLKVGLWCIQEDPSLRPTMKKVTQMLEGVVEVEVPPCPSQFSFLNPYSLKIKRVIDFQHGLLMVYSRAMGRVEPASVEAWLGIIIVPTTTSGGTRVSRERDSFPTDVILPGQTIEKGGGLTSRPNFSPGRISDQKVMLSGEIVFPWEISINQRLSILMECSHIISIRRTTLLGMKADLTFGLHWIIFARQVVFTGSGTYGYTSICSLGTNERSICECPRGCSSLDPRDDHGSCKPNFILGCEEGIQSVDDVYAWKRVKEEEESGYSNPCGIGAIRYKDLKEAPCGFKEELGRGAFGVVCKGKMETSSGNLVAVKKLRQNGSRIRRQSHKDTAISGAMGRVEPASVEAWLSIVIVPPPSWCGTRESRERGCMC